jgi:signal transduction histidine kinase
LTIWYTLIITLVGVLFSVVLYNVSLRELDDRLHRQQIDFGYMPAPNSSNPSPLGKEVNKEFDTQHNEGAHDLFVDLLYFNAIVLIATGSASYLLAKRTLEPIEEAHEAQKRFTADASHELRTPLTAMKAEIEVALRAKDKHLDDVVGLLGSNLEEVDKLHGLVEALLEIARYHEDGSPRAFTECNLQTIVEEAQKRVSRTAEQHEIDFEVETEKATVMGDEASLVELIVIFLDNAIKYSLDKSKVHIGLSKQGHHAIVTVYDHGAGIDRNALPHIFERFYRAEQSRSKDKTTGFGLGLSLAKLIADRHHARINVESELGKGTLVHVTLPLAH